MSLENGVEKVKYFESLASVTLTNSTERESVCFGLRNRV